jgi:hypothetical protein
LLRLPAAALLSIDQGELVRAVELYEVACSDPYKANSQWFVDVYDKQIAAMSKSLTTEVVDTARQRGREREPWETAEELLAELESVWTRASVRDRTSKVVFEVVLDEKRME